MTREFHRRAETFCSELASEAAEQFDTTLLYNRVHETVDGQHNRDHDLLVALDLAYRARDLGQRTDSEALDNATHSAARTLNGPVDALVDEAIARACRDALVEGSDWTDAWDARDVSEAQGEALDWVGDHPEACDRAGVLEDAQEVGPGELVGVETDA